MLHIYFIALSFLVELMFAIEYLACLIKHMHGELDGFIYFFNFKFIFLSMRAILKDYYSLSKFQMANIQIQTFMKPWGGQFGHW